MITEEPRQQVVIWSGGADSTMLLTERAAKSSWKTPIIAITLDVHPLINKKQLASQRAAQKRFLVWAKNKGMHIQHVRVTVAATGLSGKTGDAANQAQTWLAHLAPYFPRRCLALFGYIRTDSFWHHKHEALEVLRTLQNMGDPKADWEVEYPYEWTTKSAIVQSLKGWKVPNNCWWTCDQPARVGVACGNCHKCLELKQGRKESRARTTPDVQAS